VVASIAVVSVGAAAAVAAFFLAPNGNQSDTTTASAPTTPSASTGSTTTSATTSATPTTTAPAPPMRSRALLLAPEEIDAIMNTTGMASSTEDFLEEPLTGSTEPIGCISAAQAGADWGNYNDAGTKRYKDLAIQRVAPNAQVKAPTELVQAVSRLANDEAAQQFVEGTKYGWNKCQDQTVKIRWAGGTDKSTSYIGVVKDAGNGIVTMNIVDGFGRNCQRAVSAKNSVVIDIRACSPTITAEVATAVVQKIQQKIS